ncbi:MAG: hypothetical protein N2171_06260 [Clostridia bacterium]|nr:hypothetical protein [Clostridia bacterium]
MRVQLQKSFFIDNLIVILTFLTILFALVAIWFSRSWGLLWDAAINHYVAWLISEGKVPYRDIFDVQFPGTYIIHWLVIKCIGGSDIHWRLFDLGCLVFINVLIMLYCRPFGWLTGWIGIALFSAFHLYNGPLYIGQRDYVLLLLVLGAKYCIVRFLEGCRGSGFLAGAGLLLGFAVAIKPYCGLLFLLLLVIILVSDMHTGSKWVKHSSIFILFSTIIPMLFSIWLWKINALPYLIDIFYNYLVPFYSKFIFQPFRTDDLVNFLGVPLIEIICIIIITIWTLFLSRKNRFRIALLVVGMIYGILHFYFQTRNSYQLYPLALFMFMGVASCTSFIHGTAPRIIKFFIVLILLHCYMITIYRSSSSLVATPLHHITSFPCKEQLINDLNGKIKQTDTVQVLDFVSGHIHALYVLRCKQPTRFLFDAQFFHDIDSPYIQSLRKEYLQDISIQPPTYIILSIQSWPVNGYERIETFPLFRDWLYENYTLVHEIKDCYRLYKYKNLSQG